ncbi:mycothiol system anti-sigma-R factor [Nocardioides limicola]|uniref:mycothiol system anti-sigma-R factor n=1 Tax=Nocardioides limicola TaxID=2803368 RepID=UPI0027DAC726|nr:mycothiol system anti-sigma-R factor [Nocardioides sp. DJM-14]
MNDDRECMEYLQQIVRLLDNELDASGCADVRRHLEECGPCRHAHDLERTVKQLVARSCAEKAPEDLRAKVMLEIHHVQLRISEG